MTDEMDEPTDEIEDALDRLIEEGDVDGVRKVFSEHPDYLRRCWNDHWSWVKLAVQADNIPMVEALLELGCDINEGTKGHPDETPLWTALCDDNVPMVRLLLEHGADATRERLVISGIAGTKENSLEMVKLLEQHGADIHRVYMNELSKQPMNALSEAITWDKEDVADYLHSRGAVLPEAGAQAAAPQTLADEVVAYFNEHFGPPQPLSLIEIVPTAWPPITIHVIPASKERKYVTLFTTGMSDEPMQVPEGEEEFRYAEIFIQLPADWKYTEVGDPKHGWPMHWLRSSAQYPHLNDTWLGGPVTLIANDDPPKPLASNTRFTTLLLLALNSFVSRDGRTIQLYRMSPLYTEERDLEMREGIDALMRAFDRYNLSFIIDLNRPNVAK